MPRPDYIAEDRDVLGVVKWFDSAKGYGFITVDEEGYGDVFIHRNQTNFDPTKGDRVTFNIANDFRRKRTYAVEVKLA